jgi:hypothetical protein
MFLILEFHAQVLLQGPWAVAIAFMVTKDQLISPGSHRVPGSHLGKVTKPSGHFTS